MLRNRLGLFFVLTLKSGQSGQIEAVPGNLDYCYTGLATRDAARIRARFPFACEKLGTSVQLEEDSVAIRT